MTPLAALHIASAIAALVLGALVLRRRKGDGRHRAFGRMYFASMLTVNLTALPITRLFGGFGPFHAAALVSLATVIPGVLVVRKKNPGWLEKHYFWMTFSYVGLLAAATSEALTRVPAAPFWGAVAIASLLTILIGGALIFAKAEASLRPFRKNAPGYENRVL